MPTSTAAAPPFISALSTSKLAALSIGGASASSIAAIQCPSVSWTKHDTTCIDLLHFG